MLTVLESRSRTIVKSYRSVAALLIAVIVVGARGPVFADGDAFFNLHNLGLFDTSGIPLEDQIIYAGSVKDIKGNYIVDATIIVSVDLPASVGGKTVTYNAYTDILGRYRTLNASTVVKIMTDQTFEIDPSQVNISVEKDGYRMVRRLDRSRRSQKGGVFEINFEMAAADQTGQR